MHVNLGPNLGNKWKISRTANPPLNGKVFRILSSPHTIPAPMLAFPLPDIAGGGDRVVIGPLRTTFADGISTEGLTPYDCRRVSIITVRQVRYPPHFGLGTRCDRRSVILFPYDII